MNFRRIKSLESFLRWSSNLKEYAVAMRLLLEEIAENSSNSGVQSYRKAIAFYADKLDQRWD